MAGCRRYVTTTQCSGIFDPGIFDDVQFVFAGAFIRERRGDRCRGLDIEDLFAAGARGFLVEGVAFVGCLPVVGLPGFQRLFAGRWYAAASDGHFAGFFDQRFTFFFGVNLVEDFPGRGRGVRPGERGGVLDFRPFQHRQFFAFFAFPRELCGQRGFRLDVEDLFAAGARGFLVEGVAFVGCLPVVGLPGFQRLFAGRWYAAASDGHFAGFFDQRFTFFFGVNLVEDFPGRGRGVRPGERGGVLDFRPFQHRQFFAFFAFPRELRGQRGFRLDVEDLFAAGARGFLVEGVAFVGCLPVVGLPGFQRLFAGRWYAAASDGHFAGFFDQRFTFFFGVNLVEDFPGRGRGVRPGERGGVLDFRPFQHRQFFAFFAFPRELRGQRGFRLDVEDLFAAGARGFLVEGVAFVGCLPVVGLPGFQRLFAGRWYAAASDGHFAGFFDQRFTFFFGVNLVEDFPGRGRGVRPGERGGVLDFRPFQHRQFFAFFAFPRELRGQRGFRLDVEDLFAAGARGFLVEGVAFVGCLPVVGLPGFQRLFAGRWYAAASDGHFAGFFDQRFTFFFGVNLVEDFPGRGRGVRPGERGGVLDFRPFQHRQFFAFFAFPRELRGQRGFRLDVEDLFAAGARGFLGEGVAFVGCLPVVGLPGFQR